MNHARQKAVVIPSRQIKEKEKGEETTVDPSHGRQLLVYQLATARQAEFASFYVKTVMPWLQKRDIKARSWIAGNHLFALVSPNNQPWFGAWGIPQLDHYVVGDYLEAQELPNLE